jgi:EpsI family protein
MACQSNTCASAFGEWHEEANLLAQVINPQGYRIMLSIAYGKNQSDALQLHKPEICYPAQGFTLLAKQNTPLDLLGKPIAAIAAIAPMHRARFAGDQASLPLQTQTDPQ